MKKIASCSVVGSWVCKRPRAIIHLIERRIDNFKFATGLHLDLSYSIPGEQLPEGWEVHKYPHHTCHLRMFSHNQDNYPLIREACELGGMLTDERTVWNASMGYILYSCGVQVATMYMPIAHPPVRLPEEISLEEAQRRLNIAERRLALLTESLREPLTLYSKVFDEVQILDNLLRGVVFETEEEKVIN